MTNRRISESIGVQSELDIHQLSELAIKGLRPMFDIESKLFCFRLLRTASGLIPEGHSHRYTVMTLLGLHQAEMAGLMSSIDIRGAMNGLVQDRSWANNIGDLGLILWGCATILPERLTEVCSRVNLERAFEQSREVRQGRTMELAWLLSGLAHASLSVPRRFDVLTDLAGKTHGLLRGNQGAQGIFGHLSRTRTVAGFLRGRIGSFADQVYPIYALSKFGQAFSVPVALEEARKCADAICRVQGRMGQWWWHYDASTGRVMERFPVYSVHQEGMGPMALFALAKAAGLDYSEQIYRGLSWISGMNEMNRDLRDASGIVWRCLHLGTKYEIYRSRMESVLRSNAGGDSPEKLSVLFECRPYELGWLLYAFAGRQSL